MLQLLACRSVVLQSAERTFCMPGVSDRNIATASSVASNLPPDRTSVFY